MSKIKMRCITCGKWFQSANAKEVTCPDCTQKARREKLATKNAPPVSNKPAGPTGQSAPIRPPAPPKPKPVQSGTSHWLDTLDDVKVGQPDQPPPRPKLPTPPVSRDNRGGPGGNRDDRGPGGYRDQRGPGGYRDDRGPGGYRESIGRGPGGYREQEQRGPGGYRVGGGAGLPATVGQRPRQPMEGGPGRGPRPDKQRPGAPGGQKPRGRSGPPKPPAPPKPKREKIPPPPPFTPTPEQIAQVENRYLELATPTEFDGIRTQIAKEVSIPKKAVKKIIKDLRDRQNIPSWWEIQTYKGSEEELQRIKAAYEPLLPVPPVGVHKKIAEELSLKPGTVYQAIKAIRLEMNLPQYNDPTLHGLEAKEAQTSDEQHMPTEEQAQPAAEVAEAVPVPTGESTEQPVASVSESKQEHE